MHIYYTSVLATKYWMNEIIHTYLRYLIYVPVHHCWVKTIIFNSWQFYSETSELGFFEISFIVFEWKR